MLTKYMFFFALALANDDFIFAALDSIKFPLFKSCAWQL